ncbi:MAG: hypothetical protein K8H86_03665 [Ignavibacteriaceae bacterium]|nr:hypothetical protein [Ignavibacteriaceae bacterium]
MIADEILKEFAMLHGDCIEATAWNMLLTPGVAHVRRLDTFLTSFEILDDLLLRTVQ